MTEGPPEINNVPNDFKEMRACWFCGLLKTPNQFEKDGCGNQCQKVVFDLDAEELEIYTTRNWSGVIAITIPPKSWVARWQRTEKFVPGVYCLALKEPLPEELATLADDHGFKYRYRTINDKNQ